MQAPVQSMLCFEHNLDVPSLLGRIFFLRQAQDIAMSLYTLYVRPSLSFFNKQSSLTLNLNDILAAWI